MEKSSPCRHSLSHNDNSKQILYITLLVTLISVAGIALPYPVLAPLFDAGTSPLTQFMGIPKELLFGIVLGIYPLGIIIGGSFIGALSDHLGRRKVLTYTMFGSAISYGLTGFAVVSQSFVLFCLARLITGICEGNIAIARAIAADLHPKIDKTHSFSLISAMGYGGYLLGPLIGGQLASAGIEVVFYCAAIACLMCTFICYGLLPSNLDQKVENAEKGSSLILLKDAPLRRFFLVYLMLTLGVNIYYEFYPLWMVQDLDYGPKGISWSTIFLTSCMIATSVLINPKITNKMSHATAALLGMLLFSGALASVPFMSATNFLVSFALIGAGIAIYNGFLPAYISTAYEHKGQGQLMGMLVTIFCLGNVFAAVIGSILSLYSVYWALMFGAVIVSLAIALFFHGHFKAVLWQTPSSTIPQDSK